VRGAGGSRDTSQYDILPLRGAERCGKLAAVSAFIEGAMIHHISIPVRDPGHVAKVLAELAGWSVRPFMGPVPGAIMLLSEDAHGTAIELYPQDTAMRPGEGEAQGFAGRGEPPEAVAFHAL